MERTDSTELSSELYKHGMHTPVHRAWAHPLMMGKLVIKLLGEIDVSIAVYIHIGVEMSYGAPKYEQSCLCYMSLKIKFKRKIRDWTPNKNKL